MMNDNNPLCLNKIDDHPDDLEFYGEDPQGPYPAADSSNNVNVSPVAIPFADKVVSHVNNVLNVGRDSSDMRIDIYANALSCVVQKLEDLGI